MKRYQHEPPTTAKVVKRSIHNSPRIQKRRSVPDRQNLTRPPTSPPRACILMHFSPKTFHLEEFDHRGPTRVVALVGKHNMTLRTKTHLHWRCDRMGLQQNDFGAAKGMPEAS